jgi:hypothetical protein
VSHDCALLLQIGELLLNGKLPYVDYVEVNPPLIQYLSVPPVLIARVLGLHPIPVFLVCVWLLVAASTLLIRRLLSRAPHLLSPGESGMVVLAVLVGHECAMLAPDFGQREHLFLILYLPFMIHRWLACQGVRLNPLASAAIGACAGVGACIKPYFLLSAVMVEAYLCVSSRSFRQAFNAANLAFALAVLAYPAHFLVLPWKVAAAFFGRWVPLLASSYWVFNRPATFGQLLADGIVSLLILGAAVSAFSVSEPRMPQCRLNRMFAVFTVSSLITYLFHAKSWFYQLLPALFGFFVCLAFILVRPRKPLVWGQIAHRHKFVPLICLALTTPLIDAGYTILLGWAGQTLERMPPVTRIMLDQSRAGDPVLFVSTSVLDGYPEILQYRRRPASRHLVCFSIALVYKDKHSGEPSGSLYHSESEMPMDERLFLRELEEDILRNQPVMIAIIDSEKSQGCPKGFRIFEYLQSVGFVKRGMRDYQYVGCFPGKLDPFRVFIRRGDVSRAAHRAPGSADLLRASLPF